MIQINAHSDESTGGAAPPTTVPGDHSLGRDRRQAIFETLLIAVCFAAYAGQLPPDVNESHYLTKAKHFYDSGYCSGDLFLGSSYSHWLFYASTGWLTRFMSLASFAWVGRIIVWIATAFAWQRLSYQVVPTRWCSILSAMFFLLLNDRFHMAGEWVVGGLEAKSVATVFVIFALGQLAKRDWKTVWPLLGVASAFHALVGGWCVIACGIAWWMTEVCRGTTLPSLTYLRKQIRPQVVPLVIGGGIALVGVLPPLIADWNTPNGIAREAHFIYVHERLSHHLWFGAFSVSHVARFVLITVFWFGLYRWMGNSRQVRSSVFDAKFKPLKYFGVGSLLISFAGLLLCGAADSASFDWLNLEGLLRFYWFRLSDFAIPLTTSLAATFLLRRWLVNPRDQSRRMAAAVATSCIVVAALLMIVERHQSGIPNADRAALPRYDDDPELTQKTYDDWRSVCNWIRANTPPDAVFITPDQQQTFKWYAQRTEIVCWKDVPQDAASMTQWWERVEAIIFPQRRSELGMLVYDDSQLAELAAKDGATHLLLPRSAYQIADPRPRFAKIYPADDASDSVWTVLRLASP